MKKVSGVIRAYLPIAVVGILAVAVGIVWATRRGNGSSGFDGTSESPLYKLALAEAHQGFDSQGLNSEETEDHDPVLLAPPENETVTPRVKTKCPENPTHCPPQKATVCPRAKTQCPEVATQCPPVKATVCPRAKTQCPEVATQCPPQKTTVCPRVKTECPPVPSQCPEH